MHILHHGCAISLIVTNWLWIEASWTVSKSKPFCLIMLGIGCRMKWWLIQGSSASLTHSTYDSPNLGYNTTNADSPALQQINPWFFDLWSQNDKHKHSLEVRAHDIWISPFPNTGMFPSLMLGSSYQPFRHNGKQLMWQLFVWLSWYVCWINWIKWVFTYDIFNNRWASGKNGHKSTFPAFIDVNQATQR